MSGSFEDLDVPPTLVSFAITTAGADQLISPEFTDAGSRIALLLPETDSRGLPSASSLQEIWASTTAAIRAGEVLSAWTPGPGGLVEGLLKMAVGNRVGVALEEAPSFDYAYGAMLVETVPGCTLGQTLGMTIGDYVLATPAEVVDLSEVESAWTGTLEGVFPAAAPPIDDEVPTLSSVVARTVPQAGAPSLLRGKPRFLIPVFPGTNCEYDSARAVEQAGGEADIFVIRNLSSAAVADSSAAFAARLSKAEALFLPGGFSGGDEPDGSAKLITAFLREPGIAEQVSALLEDRSGLIGGICNGFQALIKLGLIPFGRITEQAANSPTLTFNRIGRHQSRLVRTRVSSVLSPWLSEAEIGQIVTVPVSHGEGRLVATPTFLRDLAEAGQIATQYVDATGRATVDIDFNPNGSEWAVEGLTSPDGRVFGKMGHSERIGTDLYRNVPGDYDLHLFSAAVKYFR